MLPNIDQLSYTTRLAILVIVTAIVMVAVFYLWHRSFTASLSGSFQVENPKPENAPAQNTEKQEGFLASLKSLLGDIEFNWDRFR